MKLGYIAIYEKDRIEFYADGMYDAYTTAVTKLKVPKSKTGLMSVTLVEKDGEPVFISTASLG